MVPLEQRRFARSVWAVLAYNFLVIAWGAFVRATGAGAGCGDHWPLCNGAVIPRAEETATLVEFTHRLTSGLALLLVLALFWWARRLYPPGHRVRRAAAWSTGLMIVEALIGAGLVLFRLVATDESAARAVSLALHLVNTFLLLGAITLTAWFASGAPAPRLRRSGIDGTLFIGGLVAVVLLGAGGAVIALGDTLIMAATRDGRSALSPMVQFLLDARIYHPAMALAVGAYLAVMVLIIRTRRRDARTRVLALALLALYASQLGVGLVNVTLNAPVWMQLIHLLMADLLWVALVLFGTSALAAEPVPRLSRRRRTHGAQTAEVPRA